MWHRTLVASVLATILVSVAVAAPTVQLRDQLTGLSSLSLDPAVPHQITVEIVIIPEAGYENSVMGAQTQLMCATPGISYEPAQVSGTSILNYSQGYDQDATASAYWGGWEDLPFWLVPDPQYYAWYPVWGGCYLAPLFDDDGNVIAVPGADLPTPILASVRSPTNDPHVFAWVSINVPAGAAYPITVYADPAGTVLVSPVDGGTVLSTPNRIPLVLNVPEPATVVLLALGGMAVMRRRV